MQRGGGISIGPIIMWLKAKMSHFIINEAFVLFEMAFKEYKLYFI